MIIRNLYRRKEIVSLVHTQNKNVMNLPTFYEKYFDEASCKEGFKIKRLEMGVVCKKYSHTEHYFKKTDLTFQCKNCGSRISLCSGTVMGNSNLPFRYWMLCIEQMPLSQKSFSTLEMQRKIGHKRLRKKAIST